MPLATWQEWQPQSDPDEPVVASTFKEKLAAFNQSLSKVLHQSKTSSSTEEDTGGEEQGSHRLPRQCSPCELDSPPRNVRLEELNAWLVDPILKNEAMAKVMRSERYTVDFDSEGTPLRVVEIN